MFFRFRKEYSKFPCRITIAHGMETIWQHVFSVIKSYTHFSLWVDLQMWAAHILGIDIYLQVWFLQTFICE